MPGLKLRSNDLAAALVCAGIESLATCREQRREQFLCYDRLLAPLAPIVRPLRRRDDDSFLMYVAKIPAATREATRIAMAAAGVATSVHYPSLARHPLFGHNALGAGCDDQDQRIMTLPTFLDLSSDMQARVGRALAEAHSAATDAADARRRLDSHSSL
jgi:dTDP-4-amino-4,6-dideoxygalactose transaminase